MKHFLQSSGLAGRHFCLMIAVILLSTFHERVAAQIRYVKPVATGTGTGTSWANASADLQAMINTSGIQQVWVAAGTYKPTRDVSGNATPTNLRDKTFSLKNGVSIYGGFNGTETVLTQRNWTTNVTILSGDIGTVNDNSDNVFTVVTGSGTSSTATIDGFTISNGNANSGNLTDATGLGGGMYNFAGSPTVTNCKFTQNVASNGGGMCNFSSSAPSITSCTFANNTALNGGGGMLNNENSAPTIINCTFSQNTGDFGGGMRNDNSSSPTITNCVFEKNLATTTGGGMLNGVSAPIIDGCTFSNNTSNQNGGGMHNGEASATVTNCSFSNNLAKSWGGGMSNNGTSTPIIKKCFFTNNSANGNAGGILIVNSSPTISNCIVSGNTAGQNGGGILTIGGTPTFTNCTIVKNTANDSGGGMFNDTTTPTITNCTITENTATANGGGMFNGGATFSVKNTIIWSNTAAGKTNTTTASIFNNNANLTFLYCLIANSGKSGSRWNSQLGTDGGNNIAANPIFMDITNNDYRLLQCSPAINQGDNSAVTETFDILGNNRIRQGLVDMGAYESNFIYTAITNPSVSLTANPSNAIMAGTNVTFTATPTNGGSTPTYVWKKNEVTIPSITGNTYTSSTFANGDKIKVEMTSSNSCPIPQTATSNVIIIGYFSNSSLPSFTGLSSTLCRTNSAVTVTGNLPASEGFFDGQGITDNANGTGTFAPTAVNGNSATVRYLSTSAYNSGWKTVGGGEAHSVAIKNNGTLWAWGKNTNGELGNGTNTNSDIPVQIGTDNNWVNISVGSNYTVARKSNGTLWAWGFNANGELGIGTNVSSNVPVQIGTDTDWAELAVNSGESKHSIAIKTNGTLWAWGYNNYGQLGVGNETNSNIPIQVGTENDWKNIAIGAFHSSAIKTDGTLWAWGRNNEGQLGTNTYTNSPLQVQTDSDWKKVFPGSYHTNAIKNDGTLWSWGYNFEGQLGTGDNTIYTVPKQIGNDNNWLSVTGSRAVRALKTDGSLWAWGLNDNGELGIGTNANINAPIQVGNETNWTSIGNGINHGFAIKADASLWATGKNADYQLGNAKSVDNNMLTKVITAFSSLQVELISNIPSVAISASPGSAITAGTTITFTAIPTNGGSAPTYQWKKNNVSILGATGNTYTTAGLVNGDKLTVEMTSNVACALVTKATSNIVTIGVYSVSPLPAFTGLNASYCDLDNAVMLTGNLPASDAFFSGPGITNNNNGTASFLPSAANSGLNSIKYLSTVAQGPAWKQVEGGYYHSIGLKEDGTLWAWGSNEYGQLGNGSSTNSDFPVQIGTATDWEFISAGIYHNFAIKKDGTLWTWGRNGFGVMGIGMDSNIPMQVGTDNDWATISTNNGAYFCVAIKKNGTLWAWGSNFKGKLGNGGGGNLSTPTQIGTETDWAKVSIGQNHVISIKKDGTLWSWGANDYGQLGNGTTNQINSPARMGIENNWKTVRGGFEQSYAIKQDGTLWAWGKNVGGELGTGNNTNATIPVQVGTETNWVSIWSSLSTQALKSDGTLWVWGNNEYGQLGNGTNTNINAPEQIGSSTDWSVLGVGPYHSFAMKANGSLFATGDNSAGMLGIGSNSNKNIFTKAVVQVSAATTTVNVCPDFTGLQTAYCRNSPLSTLTGNYAPLGTFSGPGITDNGDGTATFNPTQAGNGGTITYTYNPSAWTILAAGEANSMSIKSNGTLWGWGYNAYNELGNGTDEQTSSPLQSGNEKNWKNVSQGFYHSLGVKKDGTLWGWGYNSYGELGTADTYNENPIQIGTAANWKYVVAGYYTSLGIKEDGTLWTWGYNGYGQLGNGTTNHTNMPTQVGTDNNWATISLDSYGNHVLATKSNGTIWAWGYNAHGQLGDGTTTNRSVPKQISTSTDWATVAAGSYHSLAIKKDGTLWTWGRNRYGELGNGTTNNISAPAQIGTDKNWKTIAASYYFSLATKKDSTLWGWGYNEYGQLGNGTNTNTSQPVQVGSSENWASVEAGGYHSIGLTVEGNLYGWGYNGNGELGNGTTDDTNVPVLIGSLVTETIITKNVVVNYTAPPILNPPAQKIVCFPTTLSLNATGCAGTVKWSDNTTGASLTLTAAGTYTISATCTENGCTSIATDSIDLMIDYAQMPLLIATNMSICKGESSVLTGTCSSITDTFRWSVKEINSPNPINLSTNSRSVSEPGIYKGYCETINGCISTEVSIEITQRNDCDALSFLTITPEKAAICPGQSVTLTANGCSGSVTWLSAGSTQSGTSITYTPTKTSTITAFCSTGSSVSVEVVVAQANVIVAKNIATERAIIKATETIESDKKVGMVNFTPSANVIYEAGKSITLKPGFVAEKHSVFKAEIKTCN